MMRICRFFVYVLAVVSLSGVSHAVDIREAVRNGSAEDVRKLIAKDTSLINDVDDAGDTPLHHACRGGHSNIVSLLVEVGADLDVANGQAMTPLRQAVYSMKPEVVKLLLDRGARTDDSHPMFGSVMNQAFVVTCQNNGDPALVDMLIKHGLAFDASQIDALGMSPLDWAAHFGNVDMARLALDHGAEVDRVSQRLGRSALVAAVSNGHGELVTVLLGYDADVSIADQQGIPPIFYAVDRGRTSILAELLTHGASAGFVEPHYDRSLLHLASIKGFCDVAEMLVTHGSEVGAVDRSGRTPLFYSIKHGNRKVADYLTCKGATGAIDGVEDNETSSRLDVNSDAGETSISYLNHRGWLVKTAGHTLVFDAEEFEVRRSDNACLANGFLTAEELRQQDVIGLYSCYHGRPGEPAYMHTLSDSLDRLAFVHLVDDEWRGSPNTTYLKDRADTAVAGMSVQTISIASYMPTLGYMCHADGLTIYYQAFASDNLDTLRQHYEFLGQFADTVDIAFLPIPEDGQEGADIRLFLERFPTRSLLLLDPGRREYKFSGVAQMIADWGFQTEVLCAEIPGDRFDYQTSEK